MNSVRYAYDKANLDKDARQGCDEAEEYFECMINDKGEEYLWEILQSEIAYSTFVRKCLLKLMRYEGIPDNDVRLVQQNIDKIVDERVKKFKYTHQPDDL